MPRLDPVLKALTGPVVPIENAVHITREALLALRGMPDQASEKGELVLRLALLCRLAGDTAAEGKWASRAFELDPALEAVYRSLVSGDEASSDPLSRVRSFLREAARGP